MAKRGGGGAFLLVIVLAVLGYAYYDTHHGSAAPPGGADTGGGKGRYVALGDSYTAAVGTGDNAGGPPSCHRSVRDYPHLVAQSIHPADFVDRSCSGATTGDVRRSQLHAVTPGTTLVTLGIGGNDIGGFRDLAAHCVTRHRNGSPCRDRYTAGGVDELAARIHATAGKVGSLLTTIHRRASRARVLVVGYPQILPSTGDGCWPVVPYGAPDVRYLRGVERELNATLKTQAEAHRAGYVDTAGPSSGHSVCDKADTRWVEGLLPASPAAPLHPNARGEHGMADAVLNVLR